MKKISDLQKKFLKFLISKIEYGLLMLLISLVFYIIFNLVLDVILPIYIFHFAEYFLEENTNKLALNFILLGFSFILLNLFIYIIEKVNNKYFFNLQKNLNKETLKFLITEKYNLTGKQEYIYAIVDDVVKVFYRIIQQIIPAIVIFLLIFLLYFKKNILYSFNIIIFIIIFYYKERKLIKQTIITKNLIEQSNIADKYTLQHSFDPTNKKNVDEFMKHFDIENVLINEEFRENDITILDKQVKSIKKQNFSFNDMLKNLKNKVFDYLFYLSSFSIYFFTKHTNITLLKHIIFVYFTYKMLSLIKITLNLHSSNVRSINNVKKLLNNIEKNGDI